MKFEGGVGLPIVCLIAEKDTSFEDQSVKMGEMVNVYFTKQNDLAFFEVVSRI